MKIAAAVLGMADRIDRFRNDLGDIPQLRRGQVWCTACGATLRLDGVAAVMGAGWPMCCGSTMTIDSPEERAARPA